MEEIHENMTHGPTILFSISHHERLKQIIKSKLIIENGIIKNDDNIENIVDIKDNIEDIIVNLNPPAASKKVEPEMLERIIELSARHIVRIDRDIGVVKYVCNLCNPDRQFGAAYLAEHRKTKMHISKLGL